MRKKVRRGKTDKKINAIGDVPLRRQMHKVKSVLAEKRRKWAASNYDEFHRGEDCMDGQ